MKKLAMITLVGLTLTACGGGSGGDQPANPTVNPTAVQGTVDKVTSTSITVNGYTYPVANVSYAGQDVQLADVKPNMLVTVSSANSRGRAAGDVQVTLEPTITGAISNIDRGRGTFTVNGVNLTFSSLPADIDEGDWVMVSALPTADGGYQVLSVVEFDDSSLFSFYEVEGVVSNLDVDSRTFVLGASLNVDYAGARVENAANLANGVWVEVTGEFDSSNIKATEVEVEDYDDITDGTEVEGIVTWVANDQSAFELNYRGRFVVNSSTRFEDGSKASLKQGVRVEVTSSRSGIATEVEFENGRDDDWADNDLDIEGTVQSTDESNKSFIVQRFSDQVTVYTNRNTRYEDGLSFDILNGQRVEVEAYVVNGEYIASEIEAEDGDD